MVIHCVISVIWTWIQPEWKISLPVGREPLDRRHPWIWRQASHQGVLPSKGLQVPSSGEASETLRSVWQSGTGETGVCIFCETYWLVKRLVSESKFSHSRIQESIRKILLPGVFQEASTGCRMILCSWTWWNLALESRQCKDGVTSWPIVFVEPRSRTWTVGSACLLACPMVTAYPWPFWHKAIFWINGETHRERRRNPRRKRSFVKEEAIVRCYDQSTVTRHRKHQKLSHKHRLPQSTKKAQQ